jgi:NADPH:quinone reductase-like Zn-dependent oxidoreductase
MSLSVIARSYGGPDALEIVDAEPSALAADQVRIGMRAAGVNPSDAKTLAGVFGNDPAKLPLHPGTEVAGVVTAVGSDAAADFAPGDEVLAHRVSGGFAEYVTTKVGNVFHKPASLSFEQASGLLLTGVTAYHLLEATRVVAGDRVIVHGASGSVGLAVIQLALLRGATVVGTASERNFDLVRRYGATPVAYGDGLVDRLRALLPDGADVALDAVGTDEALDASVELVADRSRIATINGFARAAEIGALRLGGGPGADPGSDIRRRARAVIVEAAAAGHLTVELGPVFPLERAADAVRLAASGHPGGKVVVVPGVE